MRNGDDPHQQSLRSDHHHSTYDSLRRNHSLRSDFPTYPRPHPSRRPTITSQHDDAETASTISVQSDIYHPRHSRLQRPRTITDNSSLSGDARSDAFLTSAAATDKTLPRRWTSNGPPSLTLDSRINSLDRPLHDVAAPYRTLKSRESAATLVATTPFDVGEALHPHRISHAPSRVSSTASTIQARDPSEVSEAFFAKHEGALPPEAIPKRPCFSRRMQWCIGILVAMVVSSAVLTPLMFKVIIPKLISEGFSQGTGMSTRPFTITNLRLAGIGGVVVPPNYTMPSTNMAYDDPDSFPRSGGAEFDISMWNTGYQVPLNFPVSVMGPSQWTMSVARGFAQPSGRGMRYPPEDWGKVDENGWWPIAMVRLPENLDIVGGNLSMRLVGGKLRLPLGPPPASQQALMGSLVGEEGTLVPLGKAFVKGVCKCMMSGDAGEVPKILIESRPDFKVGPFTFPAVPVSRAFDVGKILIDSGLSLKSGSGSKAGSDLGMNLSVSDLSNPQADTYTAGITLSLKSPSPFTMAFENITMRLNISTTPLAMISIPSFKSTYGDKTISFQVALKRIAPQAPAPPKGSVNNATSSTGNLIQTFSTLLFTPSEDWVVGIDSVGVKMEGGVTSRWVQELADEIWVQFPFSALGGETAMQAGVWIVKILESFVQNRW
ncbi:hypothetical protein HDU96_000158 [Phlyctochytrium bullatum]|nr:hypothetical protein HDU96_000158 [Phlyctochytrium bullatum]